MSDCVKMNDLLARSFNRARVATSPNEEYLESRESLHANVEMSAMARPNDDMGHFFKEIETIKIEQDKVKQFLEKLQDANEEAKTIHRAEAMKALRQRMDSDIASVVKSARFIKAKLEELDATTAANRTMRGHEEGTATDRTRVSVTNSQRAKLRELMHQFQTLREQTMSDYKETITRRYYTVTGQQADEETIDNMIRTGESETFLQQAIRQQGRGSNLLDTVREINERHAAVKEIEKHLLELHGIFVDISVLVEAQGQTLDDIESCIKEARSFTERGTEQLVKAKRLRRRRRKWTCICILLIILLVAVLLIALRIAGKL